MLRATTTQQTSYQQRGEVNEVMTLYFEHGNQCFVAVGVQKQSIEVAQANLFNDSNSTLMQ